MILPRPLPDQPETAAVHGIIGGVLYRRLDIVPVRPRTPHDPVCTFKVNDDWFSIDIIPERDKSTRAILHSHGRFPWNGRWTLRLNIPGDIHKTYRPKSDKVLVAVEKMVDMAVSFKSWRKANRAQVKLTLVVDNTKGKGD